MRSQWVRGCRALVSESLRRAAFDPTVADLDRDRTDRARGRALIAAAVPASRAATVDPVVALRG